MVPFRLPDAQISPTFLEILRSCTSLVECSLDLPFQDEHANSSRSITILPHLRTLRLGVCFTFNDSALILFPHLTLPALEELEIYLGIEFPVDEFASLASRSACTLRKLSMKGTSMDAEELLRRLLCLVPDIHSLDIIGGLEARNCTTIAEYELVPRLQTLDLTLQYLAAVCLKYFDW